MSDVKSTSNLNVEHVLRLIEQLKPEEKMQLYKKLNSEWKAQFSKLVAKIEKRVRDHPISEEEIRAEVEIVRQQRYERNPPSCD